MSPGDTIFVMGRGGAIIQMDVPGDVHGRERFDAAVASGHLRIVPDDQVVTRPHPRWPESTQFVLRDGAMLDSPVVEPSAVGAGDAEPEEDGKPAKSAGKPEWVAYAVAQGVPQDEADAMTKGELQARVGG